MRAREAEANERATGEEGRGKREKGRVYQGMYPPNGSYLQPVDLQPLSDIHRDICEVFSAVACSGHTMEVVAIRRCHDGVLLVCDGVDGGGPLLYTPWWPLRTHPTLCPVCCLTLLDRGISFSGAHIGKACTARRMKSAR